MYDKMINGDTMEAIILASGSKGNALLIKTNGKKILVDIGISYQATKRKLKQENIDINDIYKLFITHEHSDHVKGLKKFVDEHPHVKTYISSGTYNNLDTKTKESLVNFEIIKTDQEIVFDMIKVTTYDLSHDANEPLGFVIESNNKKIVVATDTGYIDQKYFDLLKNANLYLLESNHEPSMLMDSRRPYYLKQRILGDKGHLSNDEASWLINEFIKDKDESIWAVAHISEDCNSIYNIEKSIVNIIEDPTKIEVLYTSQDTLEKIKL